MLEKTCAFLGSRVSDAAVNVLNFMITWATIYGLHMYSMFLKSLI